MQSRSDQIAVLKHFESRYIHLKDTLLANLALPVALYHYKPIELGYQFPVVDLAQFFQTFNGIYNFNTIFRRWLHDDHSK